MNTGFTDTNLTKSLTYRHSREVGESL